MEQEDLLDNINDFDPKLLANQWGLLIGEFILLTVTMTHIGLYEYWPPSRAYLADVGELLGLFILFYIAVVPFFNKLIESFRLRAVVGFWLLINYGLVSLALSRVFLETFDYFLLGVIVVSYITYAIKAPSFEANGKGFARKRPLTFFYLGSFGALISMLSFIYKKPILMLYFSTFTLLLLSFVWMVYLIYKNKDDFELLLYLPRLSLALILNSIVIYSSL